MKKLKKISLVSLSKDELKKRELSKLIGGENCCICACNFDSTLQVGNISLNANSAILGGYGMGSFH